MATEPPAPIEYEDPTEEHEPLPRRPRRRLVTPASLAAVAVALAAGGFIGGVQVQKHQAGGSGGGGPMSAMARSGGGPGGAGTAGRGAGSARPGADATATGTAGSAGAPGAATSSSSAGATVGQVANVKGSTLYVTGSDGSTVQVRAGGQAKVQRLASSRAQDVRPGDTVVVQGTTHQDGSVTASAVQAIASGLSLGFGGGAMGGAAPGGSSTSSRSGSDSTSSGSGESRVTQLFDGG